MPRMASLFATKPLDALIAESGETGEAGLRRSLGPLNLVALGIGAIIGAGIFVITGTAAAQFAGPAIVLSFLLAGVGCVFAGLCYAEFAALIPIAGSARRLQRRDRAGQAEHDPGLRGRGRRVPARAPRGRAPELASVRARECRAFGQFGWSGIARGAGVIFFAYIGFDAVSTAAQEARDPQRDMPKGILGSLAVCTLLDILMGGLLTGIVPYGQLGVAAPVALGIDAAGVAWGSLVVKVGTFAGLSTTMLVMLLGQSRVLFTMSRDGLLPGWVGRVHPRFRTPWLSSMLVGLLVGLFAALVPIGILGQLTSIGTLLAFVIVCAGVLVLRRRRPELARPFRAPWVPAVPILGIAISLLLMLSLPWDTWLRLVVWLALGLALCFGYGRRHSRLRLSE